MASPKEMWNELGLGPRVGLVSGAAMIALCALLATYWLVRDERRELFSGLEPQDAAAVVAELERLKVDYELEDGGTRILVPASRAEELRLKLVGAGIPLGGAVGFEVFDGSDFGVTEFAQRINYQRAMQGELARTIAALSEVRHARVHLVMPQKSLFASRSQVSSAAVNIALLPGASLSEAQVRGIQRLVAASVEGLEAERVTVVDETGLTLSRPTPEESDVESVSARLQKKQEVERYLQGKVVSVLEQTPSTRGAAVSVDVSLRMDQVKTTVQRVVTKEDGSGWVKRRRETHSWTGAEPAAESGDGGSTTETEYDLGHEVEEIVAMPGDVERLSIGVLLPRPLPSEQLAKIRDVVAMTVGLSAERGDSIAVHAIAAAETATDGAPGTEAPAVAAAPEAAARAGESARRSSDLGRARLPSRLPPFLGRLPVPVAGVALGSLALFVAAAVAIPRMRSGRKRLSFEERLRVLDQLRGWLRGQPAAPDEREAP